jgi:hypothetical protein
MHHAYFEPMVGILSNRIKGWNLFPCEDKITLFHPYKYEQISHSEGEENRTQSWPKTSLPCPFFLQPTSSLPSLSTVAFSHYHLHHLSPLHHPHLQ